MITIFNRAELFTDVNQEAAARVWSQGMNVGHGGIPASYFGDAPTYIYRIYVKRKDLKRAREVCAL